MTLTHEQRKLVFERSNYHCEYCKTPEKYSGLPLEIDHIIPQSLGGADDLDNVCSACRTCNKHKSNTLIGIDPETGSEITLYNPRKQQWKSHFKWSDDFSQIIGISAIGRATIARLHMNNTLITSTRKIWHDAGWTPSD